MSLGSTPLCQGDGTPCPDVRVLSQPPEPALTLLLQPLPGLGGGEGRKHARASPMTLSPGPVPSQLWARAAPFQAQDAVGCHPPPPVPSHRLPPTYTLCYNPHTPHNLPSSLNFIPDVLGHQQETTAGMPLRLRDGGSPEGGRWGMSSSTHSLHPLTHSNSHPFSHCSLPISCSPIHISVHVSICLCIHPSTRMLILW